MFETAAKANRYKKQPHNTAADHGENAQSFRKQQERNFRSRRRPPEAHCPQHTTNRATKKTVKTTPPVDTKRMRQYNHKPHGATGSKNRNSIPTPQKIPQTNIFQRNALH